MKYKIHLSNNQRQIDVDDAFVRETIEAVLDAEQIPQAEIVVALVDDPTIHQVNRDHLQHDYPTDVISFRYDESEVEEAGGQSGPLDGELVVSTDTACREAAEFGWDSKHELRLYLIHGTLHLCGYEDSTDEEKQQMRDRERVVLKNWNLIPNYST
ncbi:Endoribonuclease YbeY [Thalassoglobus neptunius]|uniref:Endoribonuclease YbeY n=1 Tax=Thalassoglobus neptunius TaxID=1938619 RepID=A0A5C5X6L8_9PLAN|nr:rRNA maturation RNase YbeY [Thalassoglobus neptunius]TWT57991.1 Endoribonuclease YbeY [Thalassoglobus neptunius]